MQIIKRHPEGWRFLACGTGTGTSPKTGENITPVLLCGMVVLAAGAGMFLSLKKKED